MFSVAHLNQSKSCFDIPELPDKKSLKETSATKKTQTMNKFRRSSSLPGYKMRIWEKNFTAENIIFF